MSSLFVLIPLGGVFAGIAVMFFLIGVNSRQFDNLDEISRRMPDDEA